jgi:apolipoprotein N-acyltransferase
MPRWLLTSTGAAASAIAFMLYARVDWPWVVLGWIGLIPWLAVLDRMLTLRGAAGAGWLMSEFFVLAVFAWLPSAIQNYTGAPWAVALCVVVLVAPLLQPQFIALAIVRHLVRRLTNRVWYSVLAGACAYVGAEWVFPKLFADTLGHGLYASVLLRQAADLAGAHGLTFVLIIANECVLAVLTPVKGWGVAAHDRAPSSALAPMACVVTLVVSLLAYGVVRCKQFAAARPDDRVAVGIVQADITHYGELAAQMGTYDAARLILDTHYALSDEALNRGPVDLLVWPETVYPTTFGAPKSEDGAAFDREIGAFAARQGVPLIFGAYEANGGDEFNAAFFLQPAAGGRVTFESYRKAAPFPLTERVPAWLDSDAVRHWLPWLGTWKPGSGGQVVSLSLRDGRTLNVAPLICYDALFPRYALTATERGAEMIVTISNDSWFSFGNVPRLILMISAFRSIETRRPQVRATNTGISAIISPTGELVAMIGVHARASSTAFLTPERRATTLMLAWGDWFGPTALIAGGVLLVAPLIAGRRR